MKSQTICLLNCNETSFFLPFYSHFIITWTLPNKTSKPRVIEATVALTAMKSLERNDENLSKTSSLDDEEDLGHLVTNIPHAINWEETILQTTNFLRLEISNIFTTVEVAQLKTLWNEEAKRTILYWLTFFSFFWKCWKVARRGSSVLHTSGTQ